VRFVACVNALSPWLLQAAWGASETHLCYGCTDGHSVIVVFSWIEATGLMEPAHERQACQLPLTEQAAVVRTAPSS